MEITKRIHPVGALILLASLLAACSPAGGGSAGAGKAPEADYGDAPDGGGTNYVAPFAQAGSFPSLFASDGARALDVEQAYLGGPGSAEKDADDANDPDGAPNLTNADSDDGLVDMFITLVSIPPPTTITVNVSASESSSGGTFYLNAVIDLNMDGEWGGQGASGEQEWVVQNQPVQVMPGDTTPVTSPPFAFSNGLILPDGAYMRVALTKEMVPANWDGTGEFSAGEIEDHFIQLPRKNDKPIPALTVNCGGPYQPGEQVTCIVTNSGGAGTFTYSLSHIGAGTVNVPLPTCTSVPAAGPGGPVPIGEGPPPPPAGGGINPVTITCNSTAGEAPDTWRLTVKAIDPPAVLVPGGIQLGMPAESSADFEFEGLAKTIQAYTNIMGGNWIHYFGLSHIWWWGHIVYSDPVPLPNATVTVTMTGAKGSSQTGSVVTGPDGIAAGWFTITQYDSYTVTIDSIEGENISYDPAMNTAGPLVFEVGPEAGVPPEVSPAMLEAFVEGIAAAVRDKDTAFLFDHLDPAVLNRYGQPACQAYLAGLDDPIFSIKLVDFSGPEAWDYVRDDVTTPIERAYSINAFVTSQGETSESELHISIDMFGLLYWFSDCGAPLP
jgi:hypothetical protein